MSKAFNETQFNHDYALLMERHRPSLALQERVLEKMLYSQAEQRIENAALAKRLETSSKKRTDFQRGGAWAKYASLAAVLLLVVAVLVLYPLLRGNFGGQSLNMAPAEATEAAAMADTAAPAEQESIAGAGEGMAKKAMPEPSAYGEADAAALEPNAVAPQEAVADEIQMSTYVAEAMVTDLSLSLSQNVFSLRDFPQQATASLYIRNTNASMSYFTGLALRIERLNEAGVWEKQALKDGLVWRDIALEIPSATATGSSTYEEPLDLAELLAAPEVGNYRIVKDIANQSHYVEFWIEP